MNKQLIIDHYKDTDVDIENIYKAQDIAKSCLEYMTLYLKPGLTYKQIHQECKRYMEEKGSKGFWIHDDPALILYSDLTTYSAHENPINLFESKCISENDFITIDVAPMIKNGWGDFARSFIMQDGKIINYTDCNNKEIIDGINFELKLHELFINSINKDMTFSKLHKIIDDYVLSNGYYNCDYHQNYGHTIENDQKDRITIAQGVDINISQYNKPITFEPHICKKDGYYGIKHENMYAYIDGKIFEI